MHIQDFNGWLTDKRIFLPQDFSHKLTLTKNGFNFESDMAIKKGFVRLSDDNVTVYAECWYTVYPEVRNWLLKNVFRKDIEITVSNDVVSKVFRISP